MHKFLSILCLAFILNSCDDGDIVFVEFNFDGTFETCGELVFYDTKEEPFESLSLQITSPVLTEADLINVDADGIFETTRTINGSSNTFNYRTYNIEPVNLFCNDVPPSNIEIVTDLSSTSGTAYIKTILLEDDNDGIPAELEDINGNGNLDDDDTDNDGIPNYIDADDDGDNVLTAQEDENDDDDDNPYTNPLDSDNDGTPDYLDSDDDGDGVLTRNEENFSQDQNPLNDISDLQSGPDYLNPEVNSSIPATAFRPHGIEMQYTTTLTVTELDSDAITIDNFDFGTRVLTDSRIVTPVFED